MTPAQKALTAAVNCEAKLHGFRKTQDGVVVSFVLHPAEAPPCLALDPLGQRYMLVLVPIGDDEHPIEPQKVTQFPDRSRQAREHYQQSDAMEQARVRAAMLAKDERFRSWAFPMNTDSHTEKDVAEFIREACGIETRRMIATDDEAYRKFLALETEYKIWTGEIAAPR
jgi:hypothetical protein